VILDDGFQHRALNRTINLLLFDRSSLHSTEMGALLPRGQLRETFSQAVKRTDALCIINRNELLEVPSWFPIDKPVFQVFLSLTTLRKVDDQKVVEWGELADQDISAIASIAKPSTFKEMLENKGLSISKTIFKKDHALWTEEDVLQINTLPGVAVVTTEKDAVKLRELTGITKPILVAGLSAELSVSFQIWLKQKLNSQLNLL